jgi:membrane protease YdiL (CAAX protease family)
VAVRLIANFSQLLYFNVPWGSRLLAVAFGILCYYLFRKFFENNDFFRSKLDKKQIGLILIISIVTIVGYLIIFIIRGQSQKFSIEEFLFYSIAVEIEEEIIFRGLLLGLLMSCLDKKILFIKYPAVLLCGLFFGFYHGNFFYFDFINVMVNCIFGYVVGWIAIKTKNILIPIIVHSLTNSIGYLIQVFVV